METKGWGAGGGNKRHLHGHEVGWDREDKGQRADMGCIASGRYSGRGAWGFLKQRRELGARELSRVDKGGDKGGGDYICEGTLLLSALSSTVPWRGRGMGG
jgi:hypothetical protein